jgi:D-glycero-D-manno-heptose 1,7-bisphosphate phosphatase
VISRWPVVFLDRDGVINRRRRDHVKRWEEFEVLPGAVDALARICGTGRDVIVVTNQSAIGRGLVAAETVDDIHGRFADLVEAAGGRIAGFLVCPHRPDEGCDCRKPAPGLFHQARRRLGVDLGNSVMVGDQPSDIEAAKAAGCDVIRVDPETIATVSDHPRVRSLAEAADLICAG